MSMTQIPNSKQKQIVFKFGTFEFMILDLFRV